MKIKLSWSIGALFGLSLLTQSCACQPPPREENPACSACIGACADSNVSECERQCSAICSK